MNGEWREYPNDPRYEVCDQGFVRRKGRPIRKPTIVGRGYQLIVIAEGKKFKGRCVHLMVLETFVGPRPEGHTVSHLNGVCSDNRLINLTYETMKDNCARKAGHGTLPQGLSHYASKLSREQVIAIRVRTDKTWQHLANEYGVSRTTIARIKANKIYKEVR